MKNTTFITTDNHVFVDFVLSEADKPERIHTCLDSDLGKFHLSTLTNSFCTINEVALKFNRDVSIMGRTLDTPTVAFVFSLQGNALVNDAASGKTVAMKNGEYSFTFNPSVDEKIRFHTCEPHKAFHFQVDLNYFIDLIVQQDDSFDNIKSVVLHKNQFYRHIAPFSHTAQRIISDIQNCKFTGSFSHLIVEGCIQQLIGLQLMGMQDHAILKAPLINKRDKDIVYALKDYLDQTYSENHSLQELSKMFGMNHNKMNQRFKGLFGNTIIEYLYNLKMEHAAE